ncbi:MAG: biotin/lipoyl-containing protein, partial [Steroidobacteraceae bacterium]
MSRYVFKLPDLGEGTVEAEIVVWRVKPGDEVSEDDVLAEVMTEKAAVEVPAPVSGKIVSTTGQPGDKVAVGAELVVLETTTGAAADTATGPAAGPGTSTAGAGNGSQQPTANAPIAAAGNGVTRQTSTAADGNAARASAVPDPSCRVLTSPAIRRRAKEAGIDLRRISGSGPQGRIVR